METFRLTLIKLIIPVGQLMAKMKFNPHMVSLSGIAFGLLSAYFFIRQDFLLAIILFTVGSLTDALDGVIARARNMASTFGTYMDLFCSAYTDWAVYCGLIIGKLCNPWWGLLSIIGIWGRQLALNLPGFLTSQGKDEMRIRFPYSLGGKGDRIIILSIGVIVGHIPESIIVTAVLVNLVAFSATAYLHKHM